MNTRLALDSVLRQIMGEEGKVYFQPPLSIRMTYPCIRYSLYDIQNGHGDNFPYLQNPAYQLILIDPNPDSQYIGKIAALPYCSFDRYYAADNLNHYVFTIYI